MTSFSGVTFVLFLLIFRLYAFVEAAAVLRSIVLRYAGAPIATLVSFFLSFFLLLILMSLFPSIFCTIAVFSLFGKYVVVRSFLPDGVSLPCHHGLDFLHKFMCEFNQSINQLYAHHKS